MNILDFTQPHLKNRDTIKEYIDKNQLKTISYSRYTSFLGCPHSWKLNYVDKIRLDKPSIFLLFGTAMHETIQEWLTVMYNESTIKAEEMNLEVLLRDNMTKEFNKIREETPVEFTTQTEMIEFFRDGIEILEYLQKKKREYYPKKNMELIGTEIPVLIPTEENPNIYFLAYLDAVLRDTTTGEYFIDDYKTSTRGWKDKQTKDEAKMSQLILYKKYYAKHLGIPEDLINIRYIVLKRKVWEGGDFKPKRIQIVSPASGRIKLKKAGESLNAFIRNVYDKDGNVRNDITFDRKVQANCKYCAYFGTEHCPTTQKEINEVLKEEKNAKNKK